MGGGALPGRPKIRQWLGRTGQLPDWLCGTSVLSTGRRGEGTGVCLPCSQVVWLDSPRSSRPPLSPSPPTHAHNSRGSQVPAPGAELPQKPQGEPVLLSVWPEVGGAGLLEP